MQPPSEYFGAKKLYIMDVGVEFAMEHIQKQNSQKRYIIQKAKFSTN